MKQDIRDIWEWLGQSVFSDGALGHFPAPATGMPGAPAQSYGSDDGPAGVYMQQNAGAIYTNYDTDPGDIDQAIDAIIYPYSWDTTDLTYSFPDTADDYTYSPIGEFGQMTGSLQVMVQSVLGQFASVAPFTFTELMGEADRDADLAFALDTVIGSAYAFVPGGGTSSGDVWLGWYMTDPVTPAVGSFDYHTMLHEVGHSLGLAHGHETTYGGAIPSDMNSMEFSVMTYNSYVGSIGGAYTNSDGDYAQSLMMLDIAAIQRLYGADYSTNATDTTYSFSTATGAMFVDGVDAIAAAGLTTYAGSDTIFRTIWDGGGIDTYDFSNYTTSLGVDLRPGEWVDLDLDGTAQRAHLGSGNYARGHIANALQYGDDPGSLIENAVGGSGDDWFIGNTADNTFWGGEGNDLFHDSEGADSYFGEAGIDTVQFADALASYSFTFGEGVIEAIGSAVDRIADSIEWIQFSDGLWDWASLTAWIGGAPTGDTVQPVDDDAQTVMGLEVLIDVLANDFGPEEGGLSIADFTQPQNGAVTLSGPMLVYAPAAGFAGTDRFDYSVTDGSGVVRTATVSIVVNEPAAQLLAVEELVTFEDGLGESAYSGLRFESLDIVEGGDLSGRFAGDTGRDGVIEILGVENDFDLTSLNILAERGTANVTLEAWDDGDLRGTTTLQVGSRTATLQELDDLFADVDRVVISSDRGILIDDLAATTYWYEPPPPAPQAPENTLIDFQTPDAGEDAVYSGLAFGNMTPTPDASGGTAAQSVDHTMSITAQPGQTFDLESAWLAASAGKNVNVTLEAWSGGELIGTQSVKVSDNREKLFEFDSDLFRDVDQVTIQADEDVVMDDLEVWL